MSSVAHHHGVEGGLPGSQLARFPLQRRDAVNPVARFTFVSLDDRLLLSDGLQQN